MIVIDGSFGEGGGQILRTSLALSLITGQPFRIENIRAGRKRPGLLRQHLTSVLAATTVSEANVEGATPESTSLTFIPGTLRAGNYSFAVGTAGSTTLVLQTVLVPLLVAGGRSTIEIEGGTHNPAAPPFDFLLRSYLPILERLGAKVEAELIRPGFYPAGGGCVRLSVESAGSLGRLELLSRGETRSRLARAVVANLPYSIAEREIAVVGEKLGWSGDSLQAHTMNGSIGPGNVLSIFIECEHVTEVCTAFGERGVRAEAVAEKAIGEARGYLASTAAVGEHLADQLLLPLAVGAGGVFTTVPPSLHTKTNAEVIRRFTAQPIEVVKEEDRVFRVEVG